MSEFVCIAPDVKLGKDVKLSKFINLYGCEIGDGTKIGAFVEIQKNATVGQNCKISSHTFICEGVTIEDGVFVGHSVTFINDSYPRAINPNGELQTEQDWVVERTLVKRGASIGSGQHDPLQDHDRRARHRGRRQRPHQRRASVRHRGRQSGKSAALSRNSGCHQMNPSLPFLDLVTPHAELEAELMEVVRTALRSAAFIGGKSLREL